MRGLESNCFQVSSQGALQQRDTVNKKTWWWEEKQGGKNVYMLCLASPMATAADLHKVRVKKSDVGVLSVGGSLPQKIEDGASLICVMNDQSARNPIHLQ